MSNHVTVMRMLLPIGDNAAKPSREVCCWIAQGVVLSVLLQVNRVHDLRNAAVLGVAADVQTLLEDAEVRARVDEADQARTVFPLFVHILICMLTEFQHGAAAGSSPRACECAAATVALGECQHSRPCKSVSVPVVVFID